jgi:hypothetical protein
MILAYTCGIYIDTKLAYTCGIYIHMILAYTCGIYIHTKLAYTWGISPVTSSGITVSDYSLVFVGGSGY